MLNKRHIAHIAPPIILLTLLGWLFPVQRNSILAFLEVTRMGLGYAGLIFALIVALLFGAARIAEPNSPGTIAELRNGLNSRRKQTALTVVVMTVASILLLTPSLGLPLSQTAESRYDALTYFTQNLTIETVEQLPSYQARLPLSVAEEKLSVIANDNSVVGFEQLNRTSVGNEPAWCTGAISKGARKTKHVTAVTCILDDGSPITVPFDTPRESSKGWFGSSLQRLVARTGFDRTINPENIYTWIDDDGEPQMVALTNRVDSDLTTARTVTAEAIIWDQNGDTTVKDQTPKNIPDITFKEAEQVRSALNTLNGYVCWNHGNVHQRPECLPAYETTSEMDGEVAGQDPNTYNPTEFLTTNSEGELVYITALTRKGRSGRVSALLEVQAETDTPNQTPEATLYVLEQDLASPRLIAERLTSSLGERVTWTNEVDSASSTAAYRVYEVFPAGNNQFVGAIGTAESVIYTFTVDAELSGDGTNFGEICLTKTTAPNDRPLCFPSNGATISQTVFDQFSDTANYSNIPDAGQYDPAESTGLSDVPTELLLQELENRLAER